MGNNCDCSQCEHWEACEIKMVITNHYERDSMFKIKRGDKIGQLILKRHEGWLLPAEYTKGEERNGGFGSTS